jgi:hypothetical protein
MIIIGIDPGMSGGIGIIPLYSFYDAQQYSFPSFTLTDLSQLLHQFRTGESIFLSPEDGLSDTQIEIYLEEPQLPMVNTQNGNNFSVQAHKKLARSLGQLEGVCIANGYPPTLVSPTRWQSFLGCRTGGKKRLTLDVAQSIFTSLRTFTKSQKEKSKVTHSTSDALLIALYGYLQYTTKIPLSVQRTLDIATIREQQGKRQAAKHATFRRTPTRRTPTRRTPTRITT